MLALIVGPFGAVAIAAAALLSRRLGLGTPATLDTLEAARARLQREAPMERFDDIRLAEDGLSILARGGDGVWRFAAAAGDDWTFRPLSPGAVFAVETREGSLRVRFRAYDMGSFTVRPPLSALATWEAAFRSAIGAAA